MLLMYLMKGTECSFNCFSDIILFMGSSGVSFFLSNLILRLILSDTLTSKSVVLSLLYSLFLGGVETATIPSPIAKTWSTPTKKKAETGEAKEHHNGSVTVVEDCVASSVPSSSSLDLCSRRIFLQFNAFYVSYFPKFPKFLNKSYQSERLGYLSLDSLRSSTQSFTLTYWWR